MSWPLINVVNCLVSHIAQLLSSRCSLCCMLPSSASPRIPLLLLILSRDTQAARVKSLSDLYINLYHLLNFSLQLNLAVGLCTDKMSAITPEKTANAKELTPLAKLYSYPVGSEFPVPIQNNLRKSGLTPTYLPSLASKREQKDLKSMRNINETDFEVRILSVNFLLVSNLRVTGFTTAELHALEAFAPYCTISEDPTEHEKLSPIHSAFSLDKWSKPLGRHQALFSLGNERSGYWEVSDYSRLIGNSYTPSM
jgi:hypothetical protein